MAAREYREVAILLPGFLGFARFGTFYYFDEENQREMVTILDRAGVRYAVNWPRELTGFLFVESAPVLTDYLNTHFATERRIGRFMILKRRN